MQPTQENAFEPLTPDVILDTVEAITDRDLTGLITPFPSYINRVYEVEPDEGERLVVKFYRPGRWSRQALLEEHRYVLDCATAEIPVVAPLPIIGDNTLAEVEGFPFALFPKRSGRLFELNSDDDYLRVGALIARLHAVGVKEKASHRVTLSPEKSTRLYTEELKQLMPTGESREFSRLTDQLFALITPLFENLPIHRIHGDCHRGNILDRLDEGLMVIDFDDMAMGPAVQDLWMLLPGNLKESRREFNLLVEGYEAFHPFDYTTAKLIEPLRAMRIIYFLAWCGRQQGDYQFREKFPQWGSPRFWEEEIADLKNQLEEIEENL